MNKLYPRLNTNEALKVYEGFKEIDLAEIKSSTEHENHTYNSVGGSPINDAELIKLRNEIKTWLFNNGYPEASNQDKRRKFDAYIPKILKENMHISLGEASRNDVWSFIGCVLMPDFTAWRFPSREKSRFIGGGRNVFQRLWWRSKVLFDGKSDDPYHLLRLPEDALVQIMERPNLMADWKFSRQIAFQIEKLLINNEVASNIRENVWRDASKRIRQKTPLISTVALDENSIETFVGNCFADSIKCCRN